MEKLCRDAESESHLRDTPVVLIPQKPLCSVLEESDSFCHAPPLSRDMNHPGLPGSNLQLWPGQLERLLEPALLSGVPRNNLALGVAFCFPHSLGFPGQGKVDLARYQESSLTTTFAVMGYQEGVSIFSQQLHANNP